MRSTRRTFLVGSAASAAAAGLPLQFSYAQGVEELKLHSYVPPTYPIWVHVLTPWAKEVESKSGGKLTVRMFPSMQLGGKPPELYRQLTQGISDIVFTLPTYTSADFPMVGLTELPGTAASGEEGTRKMWGFFDKFLARDFKDAKVLMLWNSDTSGIMSREKPVRTLEDLKGMRIRTPSAGQSAQVAALGATPVDMPVTQVYTSLERGVIDACMIPLSAAIDFKLLEVVKYLTTNAPLARSPFLVALSRKRYEGLAPDLRKIIDDTTGLQLSIKGSQIHDKENEIALDAAKKTREVIVLSPQERQRWSAAFKPLIQQKADEVDKQGLPGKAMVEAYGLLS